MANLGFGLVGYGAWGKCHARAIQNTPGCELRAVCGAMVSTQREAARETGAAVFGDYRELVSRPEIDVVDVVVPNHLHEEVALAALGRGKHVLLEKPMSTSVASCDRLIEAARKAQRRLLVGHEMRVSPLYGRIRELIASGRLGEPRYILIDLWRRPYRPGSGGWRTDPNRVGNWILEEPVHFFDAAAWYLQEAGEPASIFAFGNRTDASLPYDPELNDHFTATIHYRDRSYAVISQSLSAVEHHLSIKVFGSQAMLRGEWHAELDRSEHPSFSLEISENGGLAPVPIAGKAGELFELHEEIAAMARAVTEAAELPITPEEARRAVLLCSEAKRSLETGEVVQLDVSPGGEQHQNGAGPPSRPTG